MTLSLRPESRGQAARRRSNRRVRPLIEGLEDRAVPASASALREEMAQAALGRREASIQRQLTRLETRETALQQRGTAAANRQAALVGRQISLLTTRLNGLMGSNSNGSATSTTTTTTSMTGSSGVITTAPPTTSTDTTTTAQAAPPAPSTLAAPTPPALTGTTTPAATATTPTQVLQLDLKPLNVNLLGLEVKTSEIVVTVSAQSGSGELLGNLLSDVSNLLNLQGVNNALNSVLGSVVTLANSAGLAVTGVTTTGPLGSATGTTTATATPVLSVNVAPVHLNLLGALVDTSPISVTLTAHSGPGLILGNVITDLANLLNTPPKNGKIDLNFIAQSLQNLNKQLAADLKGVAGVSATVPPLSTASPTPPGTTQVLSLQVPPIDLNLLGLVLQTDQINVNADAQTGNGQLLGNLLSDLINTLSSTPGDLTNVNTQLNGLLGNVVALLNATTLTLPTNAVGSLSQVLQTLALPDLVNTTGAPATTPVLNLDIAAANNQPVDVNLLGLVITTNNIHATLTATTGQGQILGNLVYNVSHLLDPGGALSLLTILNTLGL